jgi:tetratricopeptide (TPR) repeat protein
VALDFVSLADHKLKDWADWEAAANARLTRRPNDRVALRSLSQAATAQADFARGEKYLETIREAGKSEAVDLNGIAWLSLFVGKVTQQQLDMAQQANMLLQNQSYATLHTLACLYAEMGKTTEARQVILQAMRAASLREPDSDAWYVFGRIYEQYGLDDAAIAAYKRVDKPELTDPESTYALAQAHLSTPAKQAGKKLAHVAQP